MANLQSTNVVGALCVNGVAVGGGKDFKFACFTGSDSWTPTSGLVTGDGILDTFLLGGGGGGSRCCVSQGQNCGPGGPGGAGGVGTQFLINITSSNDACTVTIGAGGAGREDSAGEGPGCNGGDTIFNTASIAACGAAAFGGGGGSNNWGNGGGIGIGRGYRRNPNDQANHPAGAGMGSYGSGMVSGCRAMVGVGNSRRPCSNIASQFHFTGFGSAGATSGESSAAIGRPGQGIKTAVGWVGVPGYGYCSNDAMAQPGQISGDGCNAQGYGNGGNGSCTIAAGSGSSGLVILQWAE